MRVPQLPAPPHGLEAFGARSRLRSFVAAVVGAALEPVALAREYFRFDLLAKPALILQRLDPVIAEFHGFAVHRDYPGVLEHRKVAPAYVARSRAVKCFGYLAQGERPAGSLQGVEDGAADLAQPLYAVTRLGFGRLANLAGAVNEATLGRELRLGPPETGSAQV